jgi:hypothetical protein
VCRIVDCLNEKYKHVRLLEAILKITQFLLDDHDLKSTATDDDMWEALKEKVRNYLKYQRKKNRNNYAIHTIQDIVNICN